MSSWFLSGARGRAYNWAKHPTFVCPNADPVSYTPAEPGATEGTWSLTRPEVATAAAAIGADAVMLGQLLRQRHASHTAGRLRVGDRVTDRCSICGAKMIRKGFRAWIDEPDDSDDASAQRRIAGRLGFEAPRRTLRTTWHPTKREAEAWARHERKRAQV